MKPRSVRTILVLFAACMVLPAVLAVGGLVAWNVSEVRRSQEAALLAVARSASARVDLRMTGFAQASAAIATSDAVMKRDWAATKRRVQRLGLAPDAWVAISDRAGRRLLNTGPVREGAQPHGLPRPASIQSALESAGPVVSNLFTGTGTGRMVVAADYAVPDSPDQLVVSVIVDPAGLLPSRAELRLPEGSFATILDRSHRVVARSRNHSRWQGADATPALVETLAADVEGVVFSRSLDNESTVVAWTRSDTTGWTTLVVVPRSEVLKPVWRNGVVFSLVAMGLLLLGVGLSRGFGRVLIGELKALEADAERLGHGAIIKPRTHRLENIGQVQAALSSASSELQARASRQMLMINELNHRVKNTLASVQAIAVQTFRRADPDAPAKFDQRLVALAGAHDLLTQTSWEPVEFHSVVARCAEASAGNLTASGPALMLPPAAALALCMCLHELVTNSLKHGSLSTVGGKVVVTWSLTPEGEIDFLWREEGGPPVTPPGHSGFGTRLIDRLARTELGGEIVRDYAATGLILRGRFAPPTTERWSNRFD